jgi:hypothetical protein
MLYGGFSFGDPTYSGGDCRYGPYGLLGRALRDAPRLAVSKFYASVVVALSIALVAGTVFLVSAEQSIFVRVVLIVAGVSGGIAVGLGLIGLWGLLPIARRAHWWVVVSEETPPGHYNLDLKSRHFHTVANLRCVVTDPDGMERSEVVPGLRQFSGGSGIGWNYPNGFHAPAPRPGKYRVRWESDVEHGPVPVTIASGHWTVREYETQ